MSKVEDVLGMSKSELMRRKTSITKDDLIHALLYAKTQSEERESSFLLSESRLTEIIGEQFEKHMQQLSSKIEFLLVSNKTITARCNELQKEIEFLKKEKSVDITSEVTERLLRRRNVIVAGIPECTQGSVTDRKTEDEQRLQEVRAALGCASAEVEEIRRLGRIQAGNDRLLRVKFVREEDRQQLLRCARRLKVADCPWMHKIFINPDRTKLEQEQDKTLRNELKRRKLNGEKVFIRSGKVVTEKELEAKKFQLSF
jgi:PAS domain-containing protein